MDKKKRTILLICAAILIGSYIARSFVVNYLRMVYAQPQAMRRQQQQPKPAPAPSPSASAAEDGTPIGNLSGVWQGHGRVPGGRGICDLRVELRQGETGKYSGYSRFSCLNNEALTNPKDTDMMKNFLNHMNPDSAALTGTVEKGAIRFHADKTIGTDINGCAVTEFTVTPFGTNQVAAEWKEGTCTGGSLMLQKAAQ
jgi:hypothetical protein